MGPIISRICTFLILVSSAIFSFVVCLDQENAFVIVPGLRLNPVLWFFLCVCVVASHTWICPDIRGEGPGGREAHSAAIIDKRLFIFGGCGKSSDSDDEVFYNDLYILNTGMYIA